MSRRFAALFILSLFFLVPAFSQIAQAKTFRSAYVQFDLPERWNCNLEGTEWVCSSTNKNDARESIIILTAKEAGPQDNLAAYERHLRAPKMANNASGKPITSQVKNVRMRKISGQDWVDALHLGSEIPGYYTRYLATTKDKLAILVTFSAHQKYFSKYANDFLRAIESLKVIASKDMLVPKPLPPVATGPVAGVPVNTTLPDEPTEATIDADAAQSASSSSSKKQMMVGLAVIFLAVGWYLLRQK